MKLVLASMSPYRRQQLADLGYSFSVIPAHIDESPQLNELPRDLTLRLARQKANAVSEKERESIVVGSDQVGTFGDQVLTKPGTRDRAIEYLRLFSDNVVTFHTAVALRSPDGSELADVVDTKILFRKLSSQEIEAYVDLDQPFDCAGAIKSEQHALHLFQWVRSDDPSALVGLPLIKTAAFLRKMGINPLLPSGSRIH